MSVKIRSLPRKISLFPIERYKKNIRDFEKTGCVLVCDMLY